MNVSPINNVKFGDVFNSKATLSIAQESLSKQINDSLNTLAEFDKKKRTYAEFLNDAEYDVFVTPHNYDSIRVNVCSKPAHPGTKALREHGIIEYLNDDNLAGIYNEDNKFNINDVMNLYNKGQKDRRKSLLGLLSIPLPLILATIYLGTLKYCSPKVKEPLKEPQTIERVVQDTAKIAKDTIKMFN